MTRFTSIVSTLALVPTSLALASPALASTVEDVKANFGLASAVTEHYDLNCDGVVGTPDVRIAGNVTQIHSSPGFSPLHSHWGTVGESPVDFNCDGKVGIGDWELVGQMVSAEHAPHYDAVTAATMAFGTQAGDEGYHPAADDGDCQIGVQDLANAAGEGAVDQ